MGFIRAIEVAKIKVSPRGGSVGPRGTNGTEQVGTAPRASIPSFHFLPDKASRRRLIQPAITICFAQLIDTSALTNVIARRINNATRARGAARRFITVHDRSTDPRGKKKVPEQLY